MTGPGWISPGGDGVPDALARVLVAGARDHPSPALVRVALTRAWRDAGQPIVVVHGACRARPLPGGLYDWSTMTGADRWADDWATEHAVAGVQVERHPADWATHRRVAGPLRNTHMISRRAWRMLAFPHGASRGTWDCVRQARAAGLDVRIITTPQEAAA